MQFLTDGIAIRAKESCRTECSIARRAGACHPGCGNIDRLGRGRKWVLRSAVAKRLRTAGFEVLEAANCADGKLVLKSVLVDASFLSLGS
jgi:hypothetical protein